MGILVEGKPAQESLVDIDEGKFDVKIDAGTTELSEEEKAKLAVKRKAMAAEIEKARAEEQAKADEVLAKLEGKEDAIKKAALREAGISTALINKLVVPAGMAEAGAPGAAPAEGEKKEGDAAPAEEKKEE